MVPILGTQLESIDLAEDREKFKNFVIKEELLQAESGLARTEAEALEIAKKINFPITVPNLFCRNSLSFLKFLLHQDEGYLINET